MMRVVVVNVLPVASGGEKSRNGRTSTRTRNTTNRRGGLGDVEESVVSLEHERMMVVTEKEV
jgi:hypothetical protein